MTLGEVVSLILAVCAITAAAYTIGFDMGRRH